MGVWELLLLAVGLAMDAFAVSICKGLAMEKITWKSVCIPGLWFGGFQGLMPLIGFLLASSFAGAIEAADHWIAFGLLAIIGGNMIKEAMVGDEEETSGDLAVKAMFLLAVATSIDALAAGISLVAMVEMPLLVDGVFNPGSIWVAVTFIGCVTFVLSALGVKLGSLCGAKYGKRAEFAGGVILILLGLKILLEHLGILT